MAKLNMIHGLFEVADGIWQVRGYDLSVMSIIQSKTGYIVIDPLISQEVSKAVWEGLVIPKLGDKPVVAVIYTHSHVDHYGGVRTFVTQADLEAGKVKVLAPADFTRAGGMGYGRLRGGSCGSTPAWPDTPISQSTFV